MGNVPIEQQHINSLVEETEMSTPTHVNTFVTHHEPHLDEIAGIWAIRKFGTAMFPGADTAKIVPTKSGGEEFNGATAEELEKEGFLLIGVGRGRFDEHPNKKSKGAEGKCCFDLVLEAIELQDNPSFSQIATFVRNTDLKGISQQFDLSYLVKDMHTRHPDDLQRVIDWTMEALDAKYDQQVRFLKTQENLQKVMEKHEIFRRGRGLILMVGKTDDKDFNKACRSKGAAIVIQQWKSGNTMIFTQKSKRVKIHQIVGKIRAEERRLSGQPEDQDEDLFAEGNLYGWYYHKEGQMLLNGSNTHPDTPATLLKLFETVGITKDNVEIS